MTKNKIYRILLRDMDNGLKADIDHFNTNFHGTVFHETALNEIAAQSYGTVPSYFLAFQDGSLVGINPCQTQNSGLCRISYSNLTTHDIPYGGWVYDPARVSLELLLRRTGLTCNEALFVTSNVELSPAVPCKRESLRYHSGKTVILPLTGKSAEELFAGFSHSQRNKIRKAEKLGVQIVEASDVSFDEFLRLLGELRVPGRNPVKDMEFFRNVFETYFAQGRACCLLAEYQDDFISSLIMLANKNYASVWMGGRKMGIPKNLYQNELMIWEAIKWSLDKGSTYFDLCVVDEERYQHLARMKYSFSKETRPFYYYSIKKPAFRILNRLIRLGGGS